MRMFTALAALAVAASPLPVIAADAPAKDAAASAPAKVKAKKICRESFKKTGSRMGGGRTCRTAEEWATVDAGGKSVEVQASQVGTISRTNR